MSDRDHRLDHALELLSSRGKPRNGLLTMAAVAGFALSGALLATVAGSEPAKPVAATSEPVVKAKPQADFELSAKTAVVEH
ncbi:hypothetical protein ABAC460_12330 [Asticcacaulis sp. AC460]|uniref:hypothetical protein n=1 Tax=Asticcacaulis sp. AC460 TaxID=1282360 RepID=UPI0003C40CF1|nr:hypothetical protein [Asticcacaulis sp. AC460]ESQ89650.1 hypothetical protein ABAC460_12330 [Asticcacaulis sp. AC460]